MTLFWIIILIIALGLWVWSKTKKKKIVALEVKKPEVPASLTPPNPPSPPFSAPPKTPGK